MKKLLNENGKPTDTIYQVLNKSGYPAGTETTNPCALFTTLEEAKDFIEYLIECSTEESEPDFDINLIII